MCGRVVGNRRAAKGRGGIWVRVRVRYCHPPPMTTLAEPQVDGPGEGHGGGKFRISALGCDCCMILTTPPQTTLVEPWIGWSAVAAREWRRRGNGSVEAELRGCRYSSWLRWAGGLVLVPRQGPKLPAEPARGVSVHRSHIASTIACQVCSSRAFPQDLDDRTAAQKGGEGGGKEGEGRRERALSDSERDRFEDMLRFLTVRRVWVEKGCGLRLGCRE